MSIFNGVDRTPLPPRSDAEHSAKPYAIDPRAVAIFKAAKRLEGLRNAWLNPPDLARIEPEVVYPANR
jgi:hypothetical protein